jgi:hypothetical protein
MNKRTRSNIVVFKHPFKLKGADRIFPPGGYRVLTDEELIDGMFFSAYHRISTMIFMPPRCHQASAVETIAVDPCDLRAAQDRDAARNQRLATEPTKPKSEMRRTSGNA